MDNGDFLVENSVLKQYTGIGGDVTIPESITKIEDRAFQSCSMLQSVTIPESLTEIAPQTFEFCSTLQRIVIPGSVTAIGECAFFDCKALTISAPASSYAKKYAIENNIPFSFL